jgi:amino acid transporter
MDSPQQDDTSPEKETPIFRKQMPDLSDDSEIPETELRQTLKERHVNMIGFSNAVGVGLFLSAGTTIFTAGPGAAVLAYIVSGSIVSSVMASLGEMTALLPVKGPLFEFARRFIDQSIGLATGWMVWFQSVVILATEILAITQIIKFRFNPEYLEAVAYPESRIEWPIGFSTNPAVWVGLLLVVILILNCLPVRQFGRVEYLFGCLKIIFLVGLIMFNFIINARKRFHTSRFWTYEAPYSFSTPNMTVKTDYYPNGEPLVYTGALGGLASFWTAIGSTLFSLVGWELIFFTAAENRDLRRSEAMKLATRKITLRVVLLYSLATFAVGLNVPYDDANLRNLTLYGISGGQNSAFVIAAVREHVRFLPHLFNGFFIFSATSVGLTALYSASRTLHALSSIRDAWPTWPVFESIRSRLERTKMGVPINAVLVSWLASFLAFLSTKPSQASVSRLVSSYSVLFSARLSSMCTSPLCANAGQILGRMSTIVVVSNLIIYAINCIAYLQFYRM